MESFKGCLSVINTKEGSIQPGFIECDWVARAYRDNESIKDFKVTGHNVGLGGLAEHSGLGKVILEDREANTWELSTDTSTGLPCVALQTRETSECLIDGTMGEEYVHCHWMGKVDSDDKAKGVLWMLGYLMWHAAITKVDMVLDLLL